ncbi:hypothetical protein HW555_011276 [Spodoptera exigua]|uniref:Transmembrane protein 184C n=1 Tax=Spodoptera exigua TaxID=7107 RepID=A0A835L1T3_SPOEX|nr:hypothetical protein HW555_011276 [Spodoptera exigua]
MCSSTILSFLRQWRLWIRPFLIALYVVFIIVLVPILIAHSINNGFKKSDQGSLVGGGFVLLAVPISIWQITQHVVHYTKPILQKHIIRILWMVPIYALNAWIGLEFPEQSIYVDSLRECYEAYVIYNFMKYLLNYLNEDHDLEALLETKPQVYHIFPLCCLSPWEMGSQGVIINILVYCGVISTIFDISDSDKIKIMSSKLQTLKNDLETIGSSFSRRLRGKSMYQMARGYDESSRLVSEQAIPSSSAPNLTVDTEPPAVEVRPSVYGSLDNTMSAISTNSETQPLLDYDEQNQNDPKV